MSYCIDMHTKEARKAGETEQRLYGLSAWRETPFYTERERAALAWTEALTLISENDVPDSLYEPTREHFNEEDLISLTMTIVVINGWNRLAISFRTESGSYEVEKISCGFPQKISITISYGDRSAGLCLLHFKNFPYHLVGESPFIIIPGHHLKQVAIHNPGHAKVYY